MKEPIWVSEKIVLAIHEDQLAQHGGSAGIRDENLLGASLARPKHLFAYGKPKIFDLAAAYGYGLANNHPFIDGNKRTAFMVMYTFLGSNGYWLEVEEMEVVVKMEGLTMNQETQKSIALWLEKHSTSGN
ncbi:type II toxin-antitoxin system death-on-curing family toxin [Myxosarcina sp. GI1]|uniref:type II toxin-antitoxin system death-on-curing family toxin n=1 Tax=Myxosarcina sp. GI1 TaxID=1541065 RepID=UPI000568AA92|nr:type II toxin-antitoxin system death-on-curing family toxin [Myxosarcina sp. GI1]